MPQTSPFAEPGKATLLVIGHDPRLQYGAAEASTAFSFDYLTRPGPTWRPEASKYDPARAVWDYVSDLAGRGPGLHELMVTNLCNEFLPHTSGTGTVLIPDDKPTDGVRAIEDILAAGRFRVIVPMSVRVFYHLCRLGFLNGDLQLVQAFAAGATPRPKEAARGLYRWAGRAPFLAVCGRCFHHGEVPVVPVVHVRLWPLKPRQTRYCEPMRLAQLHVARAAGPHNENPSW